MRFGIRRIGGDGRPIGRLGFVRSLEVAQQQAEVGVRSGILRIGGDGRPIGRLGFVRALEVAQQHAEVGVRWACFGSAAMAAR